MKQLKQQQFEEYIEQLRLDSKQKRNFIKMDDAAQSRVEAYLQEEYEDIMKNFDPKVVKLKKKMQVVVAPGAFDGVMGESLEDEPTE